MRLKRLLLVREENTIGALVFEESSLNQGWRGAFLSSSHVVKGKMGHAQGVGNEAAGGGKLGKSGLGLVLLSLTFQSF